MNRRKFLGSSSLGIVVGTSGCIDTIQGNFDPNDTESDTDGNGTEADRIPTEELRDTTCSHVPGDADPLEYTAESYRGHGLDDAITSDTDTPSPLTLITDGEEAENRLQPEQAGVSSGTSDALHSFADGTNFDEQALLVWQRTLSNVGLTTEVVGVTRPDVETIHAYLCEYGTGGTAIEEEMYLLRIDVPTPQQAKLTYREGTPRHSEGTIDTREETYTTE